MKRQLLFALILLAPLSAFAGQQCEKDASGEVSCTQTSPKETSQPGAVRETPSDSNEDTKSNENDKQTNGSEKEQGWGSKTTQKREPGMTY